ncbi:MAG: hypothetical protein KDD82_01095 [Planctomycetes bacterium]|nr:hypothetical protein [Planctomycetota bacterium]
MSTARQLALLCALGGLGLCQAQVDPAAAQALGQRIEREVEAQRGAQFLQGCFDAGALTALTVRGLSPTTEQLATIQASVQASVPDLIAAVLGRKNSFHLVTFVGEGAPRLVFRRVEPEGFALSYVSLYVALRGGVLRVVDAAHGDVPWSDKLRRQFRAYLDGRPPSPAYLRIAELWPQRKAAETLEAIAQLSAEEAGELDMLVIKLNAQALRGDTAGWTATLAQLREAYPASLECKIAAIEYNDQLEDYPAALAAVDVLAAQIDDPFLDFRRALLHVDAGDPDAARAAMQRALERDPRLRLEEPAPPAPVTDAREAASIYLGVSGGALPAGELDRIFDWPAVFAATASKVEELQDLSVDEFRSLSLENYASRPQRIDQARLEALVAGLAVEVQGEVAEVSGSPLRGVVRFYKVGDRWVYRGE